MGKNGFTQLPNYLWDMKLTVFERVVMTHIIRKTIGWGKQTDGISLSQFVSALGISKNSTIKALKSLEEMKIITKKLVKKSNGAQSFNKYGIHKEVVHHMNRPCSPEGQGPVPDMNRACSPEGQTKETRQKKLVQKDIYIELKDEFDIDQSFIDEILKHRRDIGSKKPTPKAIKLILNGMTKTVDKKILPNLDSCLKYFIEETTWQSFKPEYLENNNFNNQPAQQQYPEARIPV